MKLSKIAHGRRTLRTFGAVAAMATMALTPTSAFADTYTGTPTPNAGGVDNAVLSQNLGANGSTTGGVQSVSTGSATNAATNLGADAATLPVTGSDVASLALIGLGALGVGTVLVVKTRGRNVEPA